MEEHEDKTESPGQYKMECQKTGGGPKPESPSPEDLDIMYLIPVEFEVDCNKFDNDNGDSNDQIQIAYSPEANSYEDVDDPSKKAPLPERAKQMNTRTVVHSPEGASQRSMPIEQYTKHSFWKIEKKLFIVETKSYMPKRPRTQIKC